MRENFLDTQTKNKRSGKEVKVPRNQVTKTKKALMTRSMAQNRQNPIRYTNHTSKDDGTNRKSHPKSSNINPKPTDSKPNVEPVEEKPQENENDDEANEEYNYTLASVSDPTL